MALNGNIDDLESDDTLAPETAVLFGKALVLITFPEDPGTLFTLFDVLNKLPPFSNTLLLKLLLLFESPEGEDERKVAFPVRALLSKEPVAAPSSSSSSPCSSSEEEAVVEESSPSSGLENVSNPFDSLTFGNDIVFESCSCDDN